MHHAFTSALFVTLVAFTIAWNGSVEAQNVEHFKFLGERDCLKTNDTATCKAKQTKYKELCEKADGITTHAWRGFTENQNSKISYIAKASGVVETKFVWTTKAFLDRYNKSDVKFCLVDLLVQGKLFDGNIHEHHLAGQATHIVKIKDGTVLVHRTINNRIRDPNLGTSK